VKTGTFNQFIRGGIAFATPPGTPLAPKAQEGKHFLLQESEPKRHPSPAVVHYRQQTRRQQATLNWLPEYKTGRLNARRYYPTA
ncbi:hypothetical protein, partial [Escherichia coli]|uniref:hypothetical protein n=1 Tax=Escherichia coli TaxID=562 RepID=UPI0013B01C33